MYWFQPHLTALLRLAVKCIYQCTSMIHKHVHITQDYSVAASIFQSSDFFTKAKSSLGNLRSFSFKKHASQGLSCMVGWSSYDRQTT